MLVVASRPGFVEPAAMILEGLVTTITPDGRLHVAAMGPWIADDERATGRITRLVLRPFATSQTAEHFARTGCGVFHATDDALLVAQVVTGARAAPPPSRPATAVAGRVLDDACRAWEFAIDRADRSQERHELSARVVAEHAGRPFLGFNRAAHAVVEGAILATRVHLLGDAEVGRRLEDLRVLVDKTGGPREREAFALLEAFVRGG
ncbi:MAG: DUF447 domain-containing protein [Planctomycetota bacterium]